MVIVNIYSGILAAVFEKGKKHFFQESFIEKTRCLSFRVNLHIKLSSAKEGNWFSLAFPSKCLSITKAT